MPKLDESTRGLLLSNIMKSKLGPHREWTMPAIEDVVGPYDLTPFRLYDERRQAIVKSCIEKLRTFSDEGILILSEHRMDDPDEVGNEWNGFLRREIERLSRTEPPWYACGFGHPDYEADFVYWSQSPYFTLHEAVLLSLGVEPGSISEDTVETLAARNTEEQENLWEPLRYLLRRREQMLRQFRRGSSRVQISPRDLFAWFEVVQLEIHPEFKSMYLDSLAKSQGTERGAPKADKREIDTICQLFAAMAIEYYGYDPHSARSPVPREIVELAASMGISIPDDTVRKHLRRGADFISKDWQPK